MIREAFTKNPGATHLFGILKRLKKIMGNRPVEL